MKRKIIIPLLALFTAFSIVSCNDEEPIKVTYTDVTASSPYGKITDFNLKNENLKVGDILKFKVTPEEDFLVDSVTVNGQFATQITSEPGFYSWKLVEGNNRISANYVVDKDINFVDEFKINISDEDFNKVMNTSFSGTKDDFDFREDGIELMKTEYLVEQGKAKDYFINYVDGDTTHVETANFGYTIKIRYLGIDTPESTSELEEWGKSASNFNKSRLENAKYILLESQGRAMEDPDNYASTTDGNQRNLAYVWYTDVANPKKEDFRCLNLEMVYEGYSFGVGSVEDMGEYFYEMFDKANKSAEINERHLYSDDLDENYYYGEPQDLSFETLYGTTKKDGDGITTSGSGEITGYSPFADNFTLYRMRGYVTRKVDNAFYFQDKLSYDQSKDKTPEAYGMYVFTYRQTPIQVGDEVEVIGVLSIYGGSYQLQGISYTEFDADPNRDTRIIKSHGADAVKPLELTAKEFMNSQYDNVLVHITDDLYAIPFTSTYNGVTSDSAEGGLYEINKYNETYPFYNTSNKIIAYASTDKNKAPSTSTRNKDVYRFVLSQEILLDYEGQSSLSYKFFTGKGVGGSGNGVDQDGNVLFNPNGAEYANLDETNPYKDETQIISYDPKKLDLTCISQCYISTSGKTVKYTMVIAGRGDVGLETY